jgi:hypothetical protein
MVTTIVLTRSHSHHTRLMPSNEALALWAAAARIVSSSSSMPDAAHPPQARTPAGPQHIDLCLFLLGSTVRHSFLAESRHVSVAYKCVVNLHARTPRTPNRVAPLMERSNTACGDSPCKGPPYSTALHQLKECVGWARKRWPHPARGSSRPWIALINPDGAAANLPLVTGLLIADPWPLCGPPTVKNTAQDHLESFQCAGVPNRAGITRFGGGSAALSRTPRVRKRRRKKAK